MVKSSSGIKLFLVLVTVMLSAVTMVPPPLPIVSPDNVIRDDDLVTRVERSTDLTRITGTGKKIRMFIKDKYLQLFIDGTVNATDDDCSEYSILQRISVNTGQVKIEGLATCTFLCMDSCGYLYCTREFTDECVFDEMLTQHYYNTYSSTKYTDDKRSLYVAISKRGVPRRVEIKANATLGKHSSCARVLLQPVAPAHILELENKLIVVNSKNMTTTATASTHHNHRHHRHLCPPPHQTRITGSAKCRKEKRRAEDEEIDDSSSATSKEAQPSTSEDDDHRSSHHKRSGKRKHKKKYKSAPTTSSKSGGRPSKENEEGGPLTTISTVEKPENGLVHEES